MDSGYRTGARGLVPRRARMGVSVPCWPNLASAMGRGPRTRGGAMATSWNHISGGLPRAHSGIAAATASGKFS
jgi:hypothetical protein